MDESLAQMSSQLFVVRVWPEESREGQSEWRGKIQHVQSGETCYFREWSTLAALMLSMLAAAGGDQPGGAGREQM